MSTAEDFLLLVTDPSSGKAGIGVSESDAVMGGAFLFDLVAAGRLGLDGERRKARVVIADHRPLDDPLLEQAFARVRHRGRQAPKSIVTRLGKNGKTDVYRALAAKRIVQPRPEKALGVFPLTRHDILDTARRDSLLGRIRASLLHEIPADAATGPLIGLLSAAGLVKLVVDKPDRKQATARAKVIAESDWAAEGVRQAIKAAQAAMTAAIASTSIIGVAGSS
jgi:hypothetical protein